MRWVKSWLFGIAWAQALQVGQEVPKEVKFLEDSGTHIDFGSLRGRWVVLYFYPMDDTPGCTRQAQEFSRLKPEYDKSNAVVFGVSTQNIESHKKFRKKHNLTIRLVSDEKGELAQLFGVSVRMGMCSRDVVLINPEGKIVLIEKGVSPQNSPTQVLTRIKQG
ncbi:MAG: peroxiredoxin [Bacteroidia bacterium]